MGGGERGEEEANRWGDGERGRGATLGQRTVLMMGVEKVKKEEEKEFRRVTPI